jgi:hypothetical protein
VKVAAQYLRAGRLYSWFDSRSNRHSRDASAVLRDYGAVCLDTQLPIADICSLEFVVRYLIDNRITGAFVECGTWRGGATSFFARSVLRTGGEPADWPIFGFDSFEGMPRITEQDGNLASVWLYRKEIDTIDATQLDGALIGTGLNIAPEEACRSVVAASGYDPRFTTIVKGWFQEALPRYASKIDRISVLRLDGDFYESTKVCLDLLYDKVVPKGVIIIDDYGIFPGCQQAVDEFRHARGIEAPLIASSVGLRFFMKP